MRTLATLAALFALVGSACSDSDASSTTGGTAPTTTVPTTTTSSTSSSTAATTSTTTVDVEVDLPDVKEVGADEAFRRIRGFLDDLSRNPQPDLLELFYDPDCSAYQSVFVNFTRLVENGWRYAGLQPTEIPRNLVVFQSETEAQLLVTSVLAADEVFDQAGNLVREDPEQTVENGVYLKNSPEYGWRICEVTEVLGP